MIYKTNVILQKDIDTDVIADYFLIKILFELKKFIIIYLLQIKYSHILKALNLLEQ